MRWRWLLRWKNVLNHDYKNYNSRNFQLQNFIYWLCPTDRRSLSGKRPKSPSGKSSTCRFSFSAERNANTNVTEYATFGFSFSVLVFFPFWKSLNLIVCQRYGIFSVLATIIRESSDKQLVLRIVKTLPFIHQPDRVAPKASDVKAADWPYQHAKKNDIFLVCCYGFSQGRKSLYNTAVYVINGI